MPETKKQVDAPFQRSETTMSIEVDAVCLDAEERFDKAGASYWIANWAVPSDNLIGFTTVAKSSPTKVVKGERYHLTLRVAVRAIMSAKGLGKYVPSVPK